MKRVDLGCGIVFRKGWYNLDRYCRERIFDENTAVLKWQAPNELPFKDNYIDMIYSSHFFEHLYHQEAVVTFQECYRVMKSGARLSLVVPDAGRLIKAYANGDNEYLNIYKDMKAQILEDTSGARVSISESNDINKEIYKLQEIPPGYKELNKLGNLIADLSTVRLRKTKPEEPELLSNIDLITDLLHSSQHKQLYDLDKLEKQCTFAGFKLIGERECIDGLDIKSYSKTSLYVDFIKE